MPKNIDYFELLGIDIEANPQEVNLAFVQKIDSLQLWTWETDEETNFDTYQSKVRLRNQLQNARDILNHPELKSFYVEHICNRKNQNRLLTFEEILNKLYRINIEKVILNYWESVVGLTQEYNECVDMTKILLKICIKSKRKEVESHFDNLLLEFEIGLIDLRHELDLQIITVNENIQEIIDSKL